MMSAREFLCQRYLPTTSDIERELWLRCNERAQQFLEIMKEYAQECVNECIDSVPSVDRIIPEITNEIIGYDEYTLREMKKVDNAIKEEIEYIESQIRNVYYQI